ncbi:DUF4097 domain-containing protein [Lactobacillus sp. LC28-10]|uniref:DUF4097 domain-containing protein n=1 Tax=Secundilactobacillus angelensis TaxID=2722706 RepID=A0ABX1L303_9LACO|nr:DUF4097 family beta strand repeat-containing protein [Secundilactobacillus angelensis]MCH5462041.1 DUF4097 domain-containing protein [Secundilactobacillus angelensis]NLR19578.1 DUF4097 domain-containing protein [Secundilactobacillus angelensis]
MKKTFITGIIILIIGGIMLAIGIGQGGIKSIYWDNGLKTDRSTSYSRDIKNVDTINIEGSNYGPIAIHQGNVAKVTVHAQKSNQIKTSISGHTLSISGHSRTHFMFDDFSIDNGSQTIDVTVPKKTQIKTIDNRGEMSLHVTDLTVESLKSTGYGDLNLENMRVVKELEIPHQNYGDITMNGVTFDQGLNIDSSGDIAIRNSHFNGGDSRIHSGDGDVDLVNNRWQNLSVTSSDGDLNLEDQLVKDTLTANTTDGDIIARIIPRAGIVIHANSSDGDTSIYGKSRHQYGEVKTNGQSFELTSSDGDVTVTR